jgi:hypothetical protein
MYKDQDLTHEVVPDSLSADAEFSWYYIVKKWVAGVPTDINKAGHLLAGSQFDQGVDCGDPGLTGDDISATATASMTTPNWAVILPKPDTSGRAGWDEDWEACDGDTGAGDDRRTIYYSSEESLIGCTTSCDIKFYGDANLTEYLNLDISWFVVESVLEGMGIFNFGLKVNGDAENEKIAYVAEEGGFGNKITKSPLCNAVTSPSASPSVSPSGSPSVSSSGSPSVSPTTSPTTSPTVSPSASHTPSVSPTFSPSASPTISPTVSPTVSDFMLMGPSPTHSASATISPSASASPTHSEESSSTASPTVSPTAPPDGELFTIVAFRDVNAEGGTNDEEDFSVARCLPDYQKMVTSFSAGNVYKFKRAGQTTAKCWQDVMAPLAGETHRPCIMYVPGGQMMYPGWWTTIGSPIADCCPQAKNTGACPTIKPPQMKSAWKFKNGGTARWHKQNFGGGMPSYALLGSHQTELADRDPFALNPFSTVMDGTAPDTDGEVEALMVDGGGNWEEYSGGSAISDCLDSLNSSSVNLTLSVNVKKYIKEKLDMNTTGAIDISDAATLINIETYNGTVNNILIFALNNLNQSKSVEVRITGWKFEAYVKRYKGEKTIKGAFAPGPLITYSKADGSHNKDDTGMDISNAQTNPNSPIDAKKEHSVLSGYSFDSSKLTTNNVIHDGPGVVESSMITLARNINAKEATGEANNHLKLMVADNQIKWKLTITGIEQKHPIASSKWEPLCKPTPVFEGSYAPFYYDYVVKGKDNVSYKTGYSTRPGTGSVLTYTYQNDIQPLHLGYTTDKGWWKHSFGLHNIGIGQLYINLEKVKLTGSLLSGKTLSLTDHKANAAKWKGLIAFDTTNYLDYTTNGGPPYGAKNHATVDTGMTWLNGANLWFNWAGLAGASNVNGAKRLHEGKTVTCNNGQEFGNGIVLPGKYVFEAHCRVLNDIADGTDKASYEAAKDSNGSISLNTFKVRFEFNIGTQEIIPQANVYHGR